MMTPKKPKKKVRLKAATRRASSPMVADTAYDDDLEPNMKLGRAFVVVVLLHVVTVGAIFAFNSLKTQQTPGPELAGISTEDRPQTAELTPDRTMPGATSANPIEPRSADANPAADQAPSKLKQADGSIVHILRSGETIPALAKQYGLSEAELIARNNLENVATLRVGMELTIPPVTREVAMPAEVQQLLQPRTTAPANASMGASGSTQAPVQSSGKTYTVKSGDNPYGIAREHDVSMKSLLELNGIDDPRRLQIGQVLEIPES